MEPVIFGNWSTAEDVFKSFEDERYNYDTRQYEGPVYPIADKDKIEILFAVYGYGDYDGDAFVLFRKDGELYTVQGQHCSCYGLEEQWSPVKSTKEGLIHEIDVGGLGKSMGYHDEEHNFGEKLKAFLQQL